VADLDDAAGDSSEIDEHADQRLGMEVNRSRLSALQPVIARS
jgi:hypothetical protein